MYPYSVPFSAWQNLASRWFLFSNSIETSGKKNTSKFEILTKDLNCTHLWRSGTFYWKTPPLKPSSFRPNLYGMS